MLSDVLFQINQGNKSIEINKENFKLINDTKQIYAYFATACEYNDLKNNQTNDPLMIKRISHLFTRISKDLLDRFRIVEAIVPDYKRLINSLLITCGFKYHENLSIQLYNMLKLYENNLKDFYSYEGKLFL